MKGWWYNTHALKKTHRLIHVTWKQAGLDKTYNVICALCVLFYNFAIHLPIHTTMHHHLSLLR